MKWNVGTKITVGFSVTLAIFVIVGAVSYQSVTRQTEAATWVAHTREVQNQLTQLLSSLQDAETGQRGYVITGVDGYLTPYTDGVARTEETRRHLAELVSDNPRQLARADALAPLIADKFAELQQTIDVRKTRDFAAAQSIVLSDRGKKAMDTIRALIREMNSEEENLLKTRAAAAQHPPHERGYCTSDVTLIKKNPRTPQSVTLQYSKDCVQRPSPQNETGCLARG